MSKVAIIDPVGAQYKLCGFFYKIGAHNNVYVWNLADKEWISTTVTKIYLDRMSITEEDKNYGRWLSSAECVLA